MTTADLVYTLPAVAKLEDCEKLHAFLLSSQNQDVEIDCSAVTRLSGLAAQLLLMGQKASGTRGHRLSILNPSPDFVKGLETLGLQTVFDLHGASG